VFFSNSPYCPERRTQWYRFSALMSWPLLVMWALAVNGYLGDADVFLLVLLCLVVFGLGSWAVSRRDFRGTFIAYDLRHFVGCLRTVLSPLEWHRCYRKLQKPCCDPWGRTSKGETERCSIWRFIAAIGVLLIASRYACDDTSSIRFWAAFLTGWLVTEIIVVQLHNLLMTGPHAEKGIWGHERQLITVFLAYGEVLTWFSTLYLVYGMAGSLTQALLLSTTAMSGFGFQLTSKLSTKHPLLALTHIGVGAFLTIVVIARVIGTLPSASLRR